MKTMKKTFALLLAVLMCISLVSMSAFAAYTYTEATEYTAGETYYSDQNGTVVEIADADAFAAYDGTLYTRSGDPDEPAGGETPAATSSDNTVTEVAANTAKGAGDFSITLQGTGAEAGHKYTAYRIFDGAVDTEGKLSDISWATGVNTEGIAAALAAAGLATTHDGKTLDLSKAADVAVALAQQADDSAVVQKVADVFFARKGTATGSDESFADGKYVIEHQKAGYYLVTDEYTTGMPTEESYTLSRNIMAVVGNVTADVKNDKPEVQKKVLTPDPKDANQAAIGDHVFYQITGKVPNYTGYDKYFYVINDKLSDGLTFDGPDSIVVKVGSATLAAGTDYVVYTSTTNPTASTGHTFEVAFKNIQGYDIGTAITVNYSATINENALVGNPGNVNETDLTYSNNPNDSSDGNPAENPKPTDNTPTGTSPKDKTVTYVSELDLTKYIDEVKAGNELSGATFTLTGTSSTVVAKGADAYVVSESGTYYKLKNNTYTTTAPHGDILRSDGTVAVTSNESSYDSTTTKYALKSTTEYETITKEVVMTDTSGTEGKIVFKGLGAGTYTLKETVTPAGYNTAQDIEFTITITPPASVTTGEETATYAVTSVTPANAVVLDGTKTTGGVFKTDVIDLSGNTLPSTGGIGTKIFYTMGAVLVIGAGVVLVSRKRAAE